MKNNSKRILGFLLSVLSLCFIHAKEDDFPELKNLVKPEYYNQLVNEKKVSHFFSENDKSSLILAPNAESAQDYTTKWQQIRQDNPNYTLENLYIFDVNNDETKEDEKAKFLKLVHSFSSMQGIKYYSMRRKDMFVLYPECYTIDNLTDRNKIPDKFDELYKPIYVLFNDSTFGRYTVEVNFGTSENEVFLQTINQDYLGFAGIKAIKPKDMLAFIDIIRCKDQVLFYIYLTARATVPQVFKSKLSASFGARSDALFNWLKDSYQKEEIK